MVCFSNGFLNEYSKLRIALFTADFMEDSVGIQSPSSVPLIEHR